MYLDPLNHPSIHYPSTPPSVHQPIRPPAIIHSLIHSTLLSIQPLSTHLSLNLSIYLSYIVNKGVKLKAFPQVQWPIDVDTVSSIMQFSLEEACLAEGEFEVCAFPHKHTHSLRNLCDSIMDFRTSL